jgi:uncharacterized membrane protein YfcA
MTDPLIDFWKEQPVVPVVLSPSELSARNDALRRNLAVRNAIEYAAGLLAILMFVGVALLSRDPAIRVAVFIQVCGIALVMRNLWHQRERSSPASAAETNVSYFMAQLRRQRDALTNVRWWYLAPLLPGLVAFSLAMAHTARDASQFWMPPLIATIVLVPGVMIFAVVDRMNRRAAHQLDREIAQVDHGSAEESAR